MSGCKSSRSPSIHYEERTNRPFRISLLDSSSRKCSCNDSSTTEGSVSSFYNLIHEELKEIADEEKSIASFLRVFRTNCPFVESSCFYFLTEGAAIQLAADEELNQAMKKFLARRAMTKLCSVFEFASLKEEDLLFFFYGIDEKEELARELEAKRKLDRIFLPHYFAWSVVVTPICISVLNETPSKNAKTINWNAFSQLFHPFPSELRCEAGNEYTLTESRPIGELLLRLCGATVTANSSNEVSHQPNWSNSRLSIFSYYSYCTKLKRYWKDHLPENSDEAGFVRFSKYLLNQIKNNENNASLFPSLDFTVEEKYRCVFHVMVGIPMLQPISFKQFADAYILKQEDEDSEATQEL